MPVIPSAPVVATPTITPTTQTPVDAPTVTVTASAARDSGTRSSSGGVGVHVGAAGSGVLHPARDSLNRRRPALPYFLLDPRVRRGLLFLWGALWLWVAYMSLTPVQLPPGVSDKSLHLVGYGLMSAGAVGFCHEPRRLGQVVELVEALVDRAQHLERGVLGILLRIERLELVDGQTQDFGGLRRERFAGWHPRQPGERRDAARHLLPDQWSARVPD